MIVLASFSISASTAFISPAASFGSSRGLTSTPNGAKTSFPPICTWNGEKNVIVPPPELASPALAAVYSKLRGVGTAVIVAVPLYPATPTPARR